MVLIGYRDPAGDVQILAEQLHPSGIRSNAPDRKEAQAEDPACPEETDGVPIDSLAQTHHFHPISIARPDEHDQRTANFEPHMRLPF